MSYNSISQFKARAYPSGSFDNLPNDTIQKELDGAASQIDAALRTHHTLPLSTGSFGVNSHELGVIYQTEANIASYRLMVHRGLKPDFAAEKDEHLQELYGEIMDPQNGLLRRITKGEFLFPDSADATPNTKERRMKMYGKSGRKIRTFNSDGEEFI